jgi:hypothetical protein
MMAPPAKEPRPLKHHLDEPNMTISRPEGIVLVQQKLRPGEPGRTVWKQKINA